MSKLKYPDVSGEKLVQTLGMRSMSNYHGTLLERLYRVKRTSVEMLLERGFIIPEDEYKMFIEEQTLSEDDQLKAFIAKYSTISQNKGISFRRSLNMVYRSGENSILYLNEIFEQSRSSDTTGYIIPITPKTIGVFFSDVVYDNGKFKNSGKDIVTGVQSEMDNARLNLGIIITQVGFTSDSKKQSKLNPKVELFNYSDLIQNITQHALQPDFIHLTSEERDIFLQSSGINFRKLKRMSYIDPVTLYYGAKVGDIFKIIRYTNYGSEIEYKGVMPTPLELSSTVPVADVT